MDEELQNQQVAGEPTADSERSGQTDPTPPRPFEDSTALKSIPRVRPEDPPYRRWWVDDEDGKSKG
jgi:hypothetical protein